MITIQNSERLNVIAASTLRRHGGDVELALAEFMFAAVSAGLTQNDPENITPFLWGLEMSARQYLRAHAKEVGR